MSQIPKLLFLHISTYLSQSPARLVQSLSLQAISVMIYKLSGKLIPNLTFGFFLPSSLPCSKVGYDFLFQNSLPASVHSI